MNYASDDAAWINVNKTFQEPKSFNSIINPDTKRFNSIINRDENVPLYLEEIVSKLKGELLSIIGSDQIRKIELRRQNLGHHGHLAYGRMPSCPDLLHGRFCTILVSVDIHRLDGVVTSTLRKW